MSDNRRWDTITTTNPINQFIPHNNLYHGRPKIKDWYFICQLLLPFLFLTEYVWDIFKPCSSWQLHMRMCVHFWMICTASFFLFLNFESYLTFNKFYFNVFILICWCYLLLVYFLSAIKSMHWTKQAKKNNFTFETNYSLLLAKMTYIDSFNNLQYDFCLSFIFVLSKTESHAFYFALTNFQFSCIMPC